MYYNNSNVLSMFLVFFLACCAGMTLAEEEPTGKQRPSTYIDDLYHCDDPANASNIIPCDATTFKWELNALDPSTKIDDSALCNEIVSVLARAKESESAQAGQTVGQIQAQTQKNVGLWESIVETSVVDQTEPCILWALSYGRLAPWAVSMGFNDVRNNDQQQQIQADSDIMFNSDPLSPNLEVDFDPLVVALVWDTPLKDPLSIDRTELHDVTGRHVLDALRAKLGADKVSSLDLTIRAGLPDYSARLLPLTLIGTVVFGDHRQAMGPSTLSNVILNEAFVSPNARDLYLFRMKIAEDPVLQKVAMVVGGKETVAKYILNPSGGNDNSSNGGGPIIDTNSMNLSEKDEGFVSTLLIAVLSAVSASILGVVCFAYCLVCQPRPSRRAAKTLEENDGFLEDDNDQLSRKSGFSAKVAKQRKQSVETYEDGVPAVQTAPTAEADDDYDIEYVTGSQVDDGVSDYDMDTLPPPSTLPDTDDDEPSVSGMSIMDGFEDEHLDVEETPPVSIRSHHYSTDEEAGTDESLVSSDAYSYIPTDTSVGAIENGITTKTKRMWSKLKHQQKSDVDIVADADDLSVSSTEQHQQSFDKSNVSPKPHRKGILGPSSDNDSQSHDSNSLFYGTDEDTAQNSLAGSSTKELPQDGNNSEEAHQQQHGTNPPTDSATLEDKKSKFEDLWKDGNEVDEVASVLNYLDAVQSARRDDANSGSEASPAPTSSLKIVDVATPVQTPERLHRDGEPEQQPLSDSVVDRVPIENISKSSFQQVESARKKSNPHWGVAAAIPSSSESSVCSTDSSKLRSLLGQSDTNDAAIVFGKKLLQVARDDNSTSTNSSNTTPEADVSMSSCTSGKLKSLLTTSDDEDNDSVEILFDKTEKNEPRRIRREEEKKESDGDLNEDDRVNSYLPASITPKAAKPHIEPDFPDDGTVYSAFSEAPSVDETILPDMGWF